MASPFITEGEAMVGIDAADGARRITEGVENWLFKLQARNLHWEKNCLRFHGASIWLCSLGIDNLKWVKRGVIEFQDDPHKVTMKFTIVASQFQMWAPIVALVTATALGGPPIWLCLLLLPIIMSFTYLSSLAGRHVFRSNLQLAGIRGLADGAAEELAQLRSRPQ